MPADESVSGHGPAAFNGRRRSRTAPGFRSTIALIGLMGAGKSTVGRRLAERLSMPFRDADAEIEAAAGRSIAELFEEFGESYFRDGERRVIRRLLHGPPHVLATGGGAFLDERTRRLIRRRALSVWLKADLDILMERVTRRNHRPLLRSDDPRAIMARLMEERYPVYAQADVIVETGAGPHEDVVGRILAALEAHGRAATDEPAGSLR